MNLPCLSVAGALNNHSFEGFYTPNNLVLLWLMGTTVYCCNPFCPNIQACSRSHSACNFILRLSRRWLCLSNWGFLSTKARSLSTQSALDEKLTRHFVALCKTGVIYGSQHRWKRHRYKLSFLTWPNRNCIAIMYRSAHKSFSLTRKETSSEACQRRARFQQYRDASCRQVFFTAAWQGAEGNSRHSDRNVSLFPFWSG